MSKSTRTSYNPQEVILDIYLYDTQATEQMQLIWIYVAMWQIVGNNTRYILQFIVKNTSGPVDRIF